MDSSGLLTGLLVFAQVIFFIGIFVIFPIWAALRAFKRGYAGWGQLALFGTLLGLGPVVGLLAFFRASETATAPPSGGESSLGKVSTNEYNRVRRVLKNYSKVFHGPTTIGAMIRTGVALNEIVKDPTNVIVLILALKDADSGVRRTAAQALGLMQDTQAVEPLKQALNDEDETVRKEAAKALEGMGLSVAILDALKR